MRPAPLVIRPGYQGSGKLEGKIALITGGDSGIGRSIAVHFAREGAHVAVVYLEEDRDAQSTKEMVEEEGRRCLLVREDISSESGCQSAVREAMSTFGSIDIVVNNAARQDPQDSLERIDDEQLRRTFDTNIFSYFRTTREALPHMQEGSAIVSITSVTAYRGSPTLLDYSATKGAIVSFTRSLALSLVNRGIRVNAVAPGPIWTPLIPASFPPEKVATFGADTPMKRAGEPCEVAPAVVFLASEDSSYFTGQVLHPNGGDFVCT